MEKIHTPILNEKPDPRNSVPFFVVYWNTIDYPSEFTCRRQISCAAGVWVDPALWARAATLEEVQRTLPPGLQRMAALPDDHPTVKEIWL